MANKGYWDVSRRSRMQPVSYELKVRNTSRLLGLLVHRGNQSLSRKMKNLHFIRSLRGEFSQFSDCCLMPLDGCPPNHAAIGMLFEDVVCAIHRACARLYANIT